MALGTFTGIKNATADYLARSDLSNQIDDFIAIAENMLKTDLDVRGQEVRATVNTVAGQRFLDLPSNFLELRAAHLNTDPVTTLKYITPDQMNSTYAGSQAGTPRVITIIGSEFKFGSAPDAVYEMEVDYLKSFTALSTSNETNFYTTDVPEILLYATLLAAEPFLQNDERIAVWGQMYENRIKKYKEQNERSKYPGGSLVQRTDNVGGYVNRL